MLEIVAAASRHGRPRVVGLALTLSSGGTRSYELNVQPAGHAGGELLLRVALRDRGVAGGGNGSPPDSGLPFDREALADPLTIIQGYLENLLNGDIKDPVVMRQCLGAMQRQSVHIMRILNTLRS